ncbi:MAG: hypothetical protein KDK97_11365, partial [Verrucomicrobiales bacterium]|nr:hypothetical protein [Verrucomicrobiales bacterium]
EPHDDGVMNNFLSGGWLELRVEHLVAEMHPLWKPGRCLQNVQLKGPEGGDLELDLFLATDGDPLHLECKSGDISQAIPKVARTVEALGLPPSRNFVVVPTLDPEAKARWQTKCPATFVALCDLPSCIAEFLPQAAQS